MALLELCHPSAFLPPPAEQETRCFAQRQFIRFPFHLQEEEERGEEGRAKDWNLRQHRIPELLLPPRYDRDTHRRRDST